MLFKLVLLGITHRQNIVAKDFYITCNRSVETDDRAQQHRFPGSRCTCDTEKLAQKQIEVETVMHDLGAEPIDQPAYLNDRFSRLVGHTHICNAEKKIE